MKFGLIYRISSYWKYPTFLIGEIWFDLQDMGFCFGSIFGGCHQGPITSTGLASFNPASWA